MITVIVDPNDVHRAVLDFSFLQRARLRVCLGWREQGGAQRGERSIVFPRTLEHHVA
jgi:hypothetical protein